MEVEEKSFRKAFEKVESTGVIFFSIPCFDNCSIVQTDEELPIEQLSDTLYLGSR